MDGVDVLPEVDLFASHINVGVAFTEVSFLALFVGSICFIARCHRLDHLCPAGDGRGRFLGSLHSRRLLSDVGRG